MLPRHSLCQLDGRLSTVGPPPRAAAVQHMSRRVQARSVEQPVALEDGDDAYNCSICGSTPSKSGIGT